MASCPTCGKSGYQLLQCQKSDCKSIGCKNCLSSFCKKCGYSDIRPI